MPFFGLVWVASWVGCFFSSTQDLLNAPNHLPYSPLLPTSASVNTHAQMEAALNQSQNHAFNLVANAAVPSATHNVKASSSSQPAPASSQTSSRIPTWLKTAGAFVLHSWSWSSNQAASVSVPPRTQLISATSEPEKLSSNPLGVIQNLLWGLQTMAGIPQPTLPIAVTKVELAAKYRTEPDPDQIASSEPSDRCRPIGFAPQSDRSDNAVFQIRMKDRVIAETRSQEQSDRIVRQIEKLLRMPELDGSQVHPALVGGSPAVKLGDRILYTVDPEVSSLWNCSAERLSIEWTNNLRIALQKLPLPLVVAQAELHSLQETGERIEGIASWYGPYFHGRQTATGERFDQNEFTAAHPSLPFDTYLKVTNLSNGKSVIVRVNDRGPYFENRSLDLSREAARSLGSEETGVVQFEAEIMQSSTPSDSSGQEIARL